MNWAFQIIIEIELVVKSLIAYVTMGILVGDVVLFPFSRLAHGWGKKLLSLPETVKLNDDEIKQNLVQRT